MNIILRVSNYISRYAPSKQKIHQYLEKKGQSERVDSILQEVGYNEEIMIEAWIRSYIHMQKSEIEIRQKLLKKGFGKSDIVTKIEKFYDEITDWNSISSYIIKAIESGQKKGKSKMILAMELKRKYPYFSDEITQILEEKTDKYSLETILEKYLKKYNINDSKEKQKLIQAMMRRGFRYDEIKKFL